MSRNSALEAMHKALLPNIANAEVWVVARDVYGLLWPAEPEGLRYSGTSVYVGTILVVPGAHHMRIGAIELHCRGNGYDAPPSIIVVE